VASARGVIACNPQGGLNYALNGGSRSDALVGILQGLAFGALQQAGRLFAIRANTPAAAVAPVPPGGAPPGAPPTSLNS
jgi:hypothetical protein